MTLTFVDTHNMITYLTKSNAKKVNDVTRLQALVEKKKVIITEAIIRDALQLNDAEGIDCLPNEEIFTELSRMGYEKPSTVLTFYKDFFSPQWKFLIHTILQCMSAKMTSWNEFSSSMDSAVICLSTSRKFIFSKVGKGFLGVDIPLFEGMLVAHQADKGATKVNVDDVSTAGVADEGAANVNLDVVLLAVDEPSIPSHPPTTQPPPSSQDVPSTSQVQPTPPPSPQQQLQSSQDAKISMLQQRVKKLERRNKLKVSKLRRLKKVGTAQRVDIFDDTVMDDVSKHRRIIADMDADVDVTLKDIAKEVTVDAEIRESTNDDEVDPAKLQEVVEVVTTAKLITKVVTIASATIIVAAPQLTTAAALTLTTAPSIARRRKGAVIRDPEETATPSTIMHTEAKSKDKGKGILRKEKEDNAVTRWKKKTAEQSKRISESQEDKAAKKQKLDEEVEELKRHLQIVPNDEDDVYTEAPPLAQKVPVVDYTILSENNKPYFKIIRADGTH
uniref:Synaptobrevin, longin-like domain protein n=1 Tax=Tanacetum cinerariifolium TaxID=118510 RepID=A0A699IG08_TANCI|nr:synaptobrevin, longin-like domain protein [Tanacetum cinerariifolium]